MQQSERDEEAEAVLHFERLKGEGMSLEEIGRDRARDEVGWKGDDEGRAKRVSDVEAPNDYLEPQTTIESKEVEAEHVENRIV